MPAGYSGTPLARKLSLKDGMHVWLDGVPGTVRDEVLGAVQLDLLDAPDQRFDAAHVFVETRAELQAKLTLLRPLCQPGAFIWVSWPKKASKVPTDVTEDVIRAVCLPMGLLYLKVCAIDAIWSGLKLMVRRS